MILVTVGTQLPFDRLIRLVDEIAPDLDESVVAQIGRTALRPVHIKWKESWHPIEFDELFAEARLIISHAGIGTILAAKRYGKPIILFPRKSSFGEHRNDHQLATVRQLQDRPGIYVAYSREDLTRLLASNLTSFNCDDPSSVGGQVLVTYLRDIIQNARSSAR